MEDKVIDFQVWLHDHSLCPLNRRLSNSTYFEVESRHDIFLINSLKIENHEI